MNKEKKISSPAITKFMADRLPVEHLDSILEKNGAWMRIPTPTGVEVEVRMEPKSKVLQSRIIVNKELESKAVARAKWCRDEERQGLSPHGINGGVCVMTPYLDIELRARGIDYQEAAEDPGGDMELAFFKALERDFKHYKTTNRRLA